MQERWIQIEDFPDYSVSNLGHIRNDNFDRLVNVSFNKAGIAKVGMMQSGKQLTRSVKVLVASYFVPNTNELFNTPINLDGDPGNNAAENLLWRPRWFAWKYHNQLEVIDEYRDTGRVRDTKTGDVYSDIVEVSFTHGLLFSEVLLSVMNYIPVFPLWRQFEWAN